MFKSFNVHNISSVSLCDFLLSPTPDFWEMQVMVMLLTHSPWKFKRRFVVLKCLHNYNVSQGIGLYSDIIHVKKKFYKLFYFSSFWISGLYA